MSRSAEFSEGAVDHTPPEERLTPAPPKWEPTEAQWQAEERWSKSH